mgnify:CR=1 FL=1
MEEKKYFGVMIDCSRNAVMKPAEVINFAKILKSFGYNMLQLYIIYWQMSRNSLQWITQRRCALSNLNLDNWIAYTVRDTRHDTLYKLYKEERTTWSEGAMER